MSGSNTFNIIIPHASIPRKDQVVRRDKFLVYTENISSREIISEKKKKYETPLCLDNNLAVPGENRNTDHKPFYTWQQGMFVERKREIYIKKT